MNATGTALIWVDPASAEFVDTFPVTPVDNQVAFIYDQTDAADNGVYRYDLAVTTWVQEANIGVGTGSGVGSTAVWIAEEFVDFTGNSVTITNTPTNDTDKLIVYRNGQLIQRSDYSLTGTTLTLITPNTCLLYTSPSPRDATLSRMPSSA